MNLDNAQIIAKIKGGSHAYGLNTPSSDLDWRGVYLSIDINSIVGLGAGRDENRVTQNSEEDSNFVELRAFLRLLKNGNTQALELVFSDIANFDVLNPIFTNVIGRRFNLFDSQKLIKVLKGYAQGERRLANGERSGKLGGKRKAALEKYGFSPKNFVQLFRLLWAGSYFYGRGIFPVKVSDYDKDFTNFLIKVKTKPEDFKVKELNDFADSLEKALDVGYEITNVRTEFSQKIADEICLCAYVPILEEFLQKHYAS